MSSDQSDRRKGTEQKRAEEKQKDEVLDRHILGLGHDGVFSIMLCVPRELAATTTAPSSPSSSVFVFVSVVDSSGFDRLHG